MTCHENNSTRKIKKRELKSGRLCDWCKKENLKVKAIYRNKRTNGYGI